MWQQRRISGEKVSHYQRGTKQYSLRRQRMLTEKGLEYRKNTLEKRRIKINSHLLWKNRCTIVFISEYDTVREKLRLFDDQF